MSGSCVQFVLTDDVTKLTISWLSTVLLMSLLTTWNQFCGIFSVIEVNWKHVSFFLMRNLMDEGKLKSRSI